MLLVVFTRPRKWNIFFKRLFDELNGIGINSLPIVALMSTFIGGVISLQTASNMTSPLLPDYTIGYITQSSTILEFSPTIISLILAGKVGSNIASEIGTMRVTEQIDALEIMGVTESYGGYSVFSSIGHIFDGIKYDRRLVSFNTFRFKYNRNVCIRFKGLFCSFKY